MEAKPIAIPNAITTHPERSLGAAIEAQDHARAHEFARGAHGRGEENGEVKSSPPPLVDFGGGGLKSDLSIRLRTRAG